MHILHRLIVEPVFILLQEASTVQTPCDLQKRYYRKESELNTAIHAYTCLFGTCTSNCFLRYEKIHICNLHTTWSQTNVCTAYVGREVYSMACMHACSTLYVVLHKWNSGKKCQYVGCASMMQVRVCRHFFLDLCVGALWRGGSVTEQWIID